MEQEGRDGLDAPVIFADDETASDLWVENLQLNQELETSNLLGRFECQYLMPTSLLFLVSLDEFLEVDLLREFLGVVDGGGITMITPK